MIGAYWVQPGVTYEEVFNWIGITFRPLLYAAEQDVRNDLKSKAQEGTRSKSKKREAELTASIMDKVSVVLAPDPPATFQPIRPIRPMRHGPVTRSNAARASASSPHLPQPPALKEKEKVAVAIEPPPSPPNKRTRYERTGPILNLPCV